MAMLTIDAASETTIKKALPFRHSSNLRDASFSSYLDDGEETFMRKLGADSAKLRNKSLISPTPFEHIHVVGKKSEDNEIDIFSADKYFNEGVDVDDGDDDQSPRIASKSSSAKFNRKMVLPPKLDPPKQQQHHIRSATPSIRSESSWNSQNALLHNSHRNQQGQKTEKPNNRRSFLASFGCNCSCGDKASVDIDDPIVENSPRRSPSVRAAQDKPNRSSNKPVDLVSLTDSQSNASSWIRGELKIGLSSSEEHFRFPVFDSNAKTGDHHMLEMQSKKEEDDSTRKSMEVFGSPIERAGKKSLNMLTWDAIVKPKINNPNEGSQNSRGLYNDDADSDASSDLFEIESFATNPSQYLTRQGSDGMSSAFTQTCYAPSEASIEWSVVTASAADFSAMSDIEETRISTNSRGYGQGISQNDPRSSSDRELPARRRTGILSGCYSQKAVNVAGNAYRASEKTSPVRHQKAEFLMPMTRVHAGNEPARFEKRNGHFGYDSRLLYKH
ncbi:OLC1v1032808C1 [Oldenlandia corymbosa var. corymbosa]|uniref:OLC1v1032808C1 n=1 Tax=Oldenlandia corymbosa var. corymbosa TaxID=529605 RepID=A0AAV1CPU6_OLDCO|nr:OLC1v1032808C1 [Oldenlandia corymbosa var. corymbosa]